MSPGFFLREVTWHGMANPSTVTASCQWYGAPFSAELNFCILKVHHSIIVTVSKVGGGPRVVVSTAAFHARVRGSAPGLGGLKETKKIIPHPRVKVSIVGSLRDREVACSASDRQGSNFESCVWRTVSSHHPQEVLLAQFSLYVHKGGLKLDSFHFVSKVSFNFIMHFKQLSGQTKSS